jgi:putative transposase
LPLEVVQIDHTLVDVVVVDELERLPLGRPWLTLAIDVASRMVNGFVGVSLC